MHQQQSNIEITLTSAVTAAALYFRSTATIFEIVDEVDEFLIDKDVIWGIDDDDRRQGGNKRNIYVEEITIDVLAPSLEVFEFSISPITILRISIRSYEGVKVDGRYSLTPFLGTLAKVDRRYA